MDYFKILLTIHIITGCISLFVGSIILFTKKGNETHQKLGKVYFSALLTSSLVSLLMAILHGNIFLFIVGIFTTYMLLSGTRYLKIKSISDIHFADWTLAITITLFGLGFVSLGSYILLYQDFFGIVLLVFGGICWMFALQDFKNFRNKSKVKNFWLMTHIQRMTGSYIASATAFLVVNNTILLGVISWLLPTAILTPLIVIWVRKYQVLNQK
jgi:uncharacterized membrane protein